MSHQTFNAIFLSDLHIGSLDSNSKKLFDFLKKVKTKRIFFVGDIIDKSCKDDNSDLIEFLDILKNKESEIIFIIGNHEESRETIPSIFNDIKFHKEYIYETGNKKIYLNHGHSYDSKDIFLRALKMINNRIQVKKGNGLLKKKIKKYLYKFLKFIAKSTLNKSFSKYMALKAKKNRCDIVISGHFHKPNKKEVLNIKYFNCGDWIDSCSYIAEDFNEKIELYYY